jgi:solute carrier family 26 protein
MMIPKTNSITLAISLVAILFLYIVKVHINHRFHKKLPAPIPVELIAVVVGTAISYFGHFNQKWKVKIVGELPKG